MYQSFIILLALATLLTFINYRYLKLQLTIGLMILGIGVSIIMIGIRHFYPDTFALLPNVVDKIDFENFLMNGILSFLLFAGSVHINIKNLNRERIPVFVFAVLGTIISTIIIGTLSYYAFGLIGLNIPILYCMLFGALISPTDPIAVLAIFKSYNVRKDISSTIEGESLFNDGIGIVIFITILHLIKGGSESFSYGETAILFMQEAVGGTAFGLLIGWVSVLFLKNLKHDAKSAVMATIVVATGGYALANYMDISGALAMVSAGLVIGNWTNTKALKDTKTLLDSFWEVIDTVFNSSLFVLIGMMVIIIVDPSHMNFTAAIIGIVIVLFGRFVSVLLPAIIVYKNNSKTHMENLKIVTIFTWSGLRGALAFALALSIDEAYNKEFFVFLTYCVVAFSIIVQGLTIPRVIKALKI
ncbi:MAG: sodium:proton antiporter [Bacteroidota bacterium]